MSLTRISATTPSMPGEIGAGHSATALYAVMFRPNVDGRIATVQLRWEDPDTHQVTEINGNFNTWDLVASFEEADPPLSIGRDRGPICGCAPPQPLGRRDNQLATGRPRLPALVHLMG